MFAWGNVARREKATLCRDTITLHNRKAQRYTVSVRVISIKGTQFRYED